MKKIIALCLALAGIVSLCGCLEEQSQDFTISQYDSESRIEINFEDLSVPDKDVNSDTDDNSKNAENTENQNSNSSPDEPNTGTLLVKDKKYTFEGKDLVIIDVLNESNQNLSITINGKYLDENGNVLKTETQTFDQFSAGYQNYFLFRPEMNFAEFTYSIQTEMSSGPFYAKDIKCNFYGLVEYEWPDFEGEAIKRVPSLLARTNYTYLGNTKINFLVWYVIFNSSGEVVAIFGKGETLEKYTPEPDGYDSTLIHKFDPDDWSWDWPDHLEGKLTALAVVTNVTDEIPE